MKPVLPLLLATMGEPLGTALPPSSLLLSSWDLITCNLLTRRVTRVVDRSWRERLFTRPWTPFQRRKVTWHDVPDDRAYIVGHTIVCHPITAYKILERIDDLQA